MLYLAFLVTGNKGWRGVGDDRGRYAKSKLQKTASFIEVEPLNVYQSTHTSCSLPWYFRSDHVDNAFATNISYSAGHLTSIPAHLE
jgi:hypothetical protein